MKRAPSTFFGVNPALHFCIGWDRKHLSSNLSACSRIFSCVVKTNDNLALIKKKADLYVEGTRLWILEDLVKFVASPSQVYVILGSAGIGKSVLMGFLCTIGGLFKPEEVYKVLASSTVNAKRRSSRIRSMIRAITERFSWGKLSELLDLPIVSAFAFKHDDATASDAKSALLSVCKQMLDSVPHYANEVTPVLADYDVTKKDIETMFQELIVEPLQKMEEKGLSPTKRAAIVFDALDECRADQRADFIRMMLMWHERVPSWLKLICSSRRAEYVIPGAFILRQKPTEMDADSTVNIADMKVYLRNELKDYFRDNPEDLETVVDILTERSEGVFLYADLFKIVLKEIAKEDGGVSVEKVRSTEYFPNGIDGLYKKFFLRFLLGPCKNRAELYQAILGAMCVSREPLPVEALQVIANILDEDEFETLLRNVQELLVVVNGVVRFVHKSMADWLPDPSRNLEEQLRVKVSSAKKRLAEYCSLNCTSSEYAARNAVYQLGLAKDFDGIAGLLCNYTQLHGIIIKQQYQARQFVRDCEESFATLDEFVDAEGVVRALEKALIGLTRDSRELPGQLMGRLPEEHSVVRGASGFKFDFKFLRPKFEDRMIPSDAAVRKVLAGHKGMVFGVALRDDTVVTCGQDQTAKMWSVRTGELLRTLRGHTNWIKGVALNDEVVVTAACDKTLKVWNKESGEEERTLTGHTNFVQCVCLSGGTIISGSEDTTVRLWELATGTETKVLRGHSAPVEGVASDGDVIASASDDKTVKVWKMESGELIWTLQGHVLAVYSVAIDGDEIVSGSQDKTVKVWSKSTGQLVQTIQGTAFVIPVAVDDRIIVSGSTDKTVKVWEKDSGELIQTLKGHSSSIEGGVAMDERHIVSGSQDGTARIWSRANIRKKAEDDSHDAPVNSMAVTESVIVTGSGELDIDGSRNRAEGFAENEDKSVRVWSSDCGELVHTFRGHKLPVLEVSLNGDVITSRGVEYELVALNDEEFQKSLDGTLETDYRTLTEFPRGAKLTDRIASEETLYWSISKQKQLRSQWRKKSSSDANTCNFTFSDYTVLPKDRSIVGLTMDGRVSAIASPPNNPNLAIVCDTTQRRPIHLVIN